MALQLQNMRTTKLTVFSFAILAIGLVTQPYLAMLPAFAGSTTTVAVYGNTATAENQPGWLFNRDLSTSTPFEFTTTQHSTGQGSIYIQPIGANAKDKFIAENFSKTAVSDFNSFSYDFKVAGNGTAASASQFYTSVYVNQVNDDTYYDCRYDYVPANGSTSEFTSFSFTSNSSPAAVRKSSSGRLTVCPATMAALPAGSTIRAFAINVGDTSSNDAGLAGYIDNVVINTASAVTTSDFELIGAPQNLTPTNNSFTNNNSFDNTWAPVAGAAKYEYETTYNNGISYYHDTSDAGNYVISPALITRHNNGAPESTYKWHVRAINANGQAGPWSDYSYVTVDNTPPTVPTNGLPNATYKTTNVFDFTWNASTDNNTGVKYEFQSTLNPAQTGGVLTTGLWKSPVLTSNMIHSSGASNGTWYWQVRAVDTAGIKSSWSPIWNMTIDSVKPLVNITKPGANGIVDTLIVDIQGDATDNNFNYYYCFVTKVGSGEVGVRDALCQTAWAAGTPFKTAFAPTTTGQSGGQIGTITLPSDTANGQYEVHVVAKDKAGNTTETVQPFTLAVPVPTVNTEDFGVGSWTLIDNNFTGYNVGFNVNDFATVTGITVDLYRGDTIIATNTATPALLAKITASNLTSLSTAFPTQGTVTDNWCGGLSCWTIGSAAWTSLSTAPTKAVITVAGINVRNQTITPIVVTIQDPSQAAGTYASILPPAVAQKPVAPLPGNARNTPAATNAIPATAGRNRAISVQNPAAANAGTQAVLGAETKKDATPTDVLGTTTAPTLAAVNTEAATTFSLAWYWWLIIATVIAGTIWLIAVTARRHTAEETLRPY